MSKKRILTVLMFICIGTSIGLIVIFIFNGKYLEAVAISGIISTLAWFALQGKSAYQHKDVEQVDLAEVEKE